MMEYKSYLATIEYDDEAGIFHGEVVNTRAVITFQGVSVEELHREMAASIDDYLAWCAERGKEPEKPYSGTLLVRATPVLHRAVTEAAARDHQSVNSWVTHTLERAVGIAGATGTASEERSPRGRAETPRRRRAG
jgi:predicted HicB family RNase H-like nuclease